MSAADLQPLVDAADTAALLRAVDGLAASRDWDGMVDLGRRCDDAVELGKQLWSVAMHIDYRLALEAPAPYAASVLRPGAARFALGPLTEVAASVHDWAALAPHLDDPVTAASVAGERVLRGEDLRGTHLRALVERAELPLVLAPWEPEYALPRYRDREAAFPQPAIATATLGPAEPLPPCPVIADDDVTEALRATVEVWVSQSSGRVEAVAVEGPASGAVAQLSDRAAIVQIEPADALALLQWTAASGGAYGRRPGGASGRFSAWWAAAAACGLDWPDEMDEAFADSLGQEIATLRWYRWTPPAAETGWHLRLAIEDPLDGLSWAVSATDQRDDDDPEAVSDPSTPGGASGGTQ